MTVIIRLGMGPCGGRAQWAPEPEFVIHDLVDNFGIDEVRAVNNSRKAARYFRIRRKGKRLVPSPDRSVGWAWRKVFKDGTSRIEGPNPELFD